MSILPQSNSNTILETTWWELWDESRQQALQADPEDRGDLICEGPSQFTRGHKRDICLRNGISLTLHRYEFHEDLTLTQMQPEDDRGFLEFVFNLSSISKFWGGEYVTAGQHYLLGMYNPGDNSECVLLAREPNLGIDIHLQPDLLCSLIGADSRQGDFIDFLSGELQRLITGESDILRSPIQTITPAMQVALQQILNCPYQGTVKQMYLESKSVEVLALWLEQAIASNFSSKPSACRCSSDQIERIYQAKEILTQQVDNPPCLMTLARQVGLNDCTLKRGFRQVFGTTVFGYLHQHRLEQARSLLLERQLSVTAIAHRVGYKNLCAFSTAFRKKFGVSPRTLQQQ